MSQMSATVCSTWHHWPIGSGNQRALSDSAVAGNGAWTQGNLSAITSHNYRPSASVHRRPATARHEPPLLLSAGPRRTSHSVAIITTHCFHFDGRQTEAKDVRSDRHRKKHHATQHTSFLIALLSCKRVIPTQSTGPR